MFVVPCICHCSALSLGMNVRESWSFFAGTDACTVHQLLSHRSYQVEKRPSTTRLNELTIVSVCKVADVLQIFLRPLTAAIH